MRVFRAQASSSGAVAATETPLTARPDRPDSCDRSHSHKATLSHKLRPICTATLSLFHQPHTDMMRCSRFLSRPPTSTQSDTFDDHCLPTITTIRLDIDSDCTYRRVVYLTFFSPQHHPYPTTPSHPTTCQPPRQSLTEPHQHTLHRVSTCRISGSASQFSFFITVVDMLAHRTQDDRIQNAARRLWVVR